MTLGQKLKALLKDNSMTQEDLAERLEVSRQAVGKWVNDKGIPEVGKLVQISNLFGVSMDYLLKEDYEEKNVSEEKAISNSGYYVSQEMLDGYLSYSRQNVKQITGGISLFILSNVFECFGHHSMIMTFLFWLTMIAGIIIIIWYYFQTKQYQEIKNNLEKGIIKHAIVEKDNNRKIVHGWGDKVSYFVGSFDDVDHLSRDSLTSNAFFILSSLYNFSKY